MTEPETTATDEHAHIRARFDSYADGTLPEADDAEIRDHLLSCAACEAAFEKSQREQTGLSGLHKKSAPADFERQVEETIRRRSAGRFFGRRAFGDRVPFELLAVIAIAVAVAIYVLLRLSDTGSLAN